MSRHDEVAEAVAAWLGLIFVACCVAVAAVIAVLIIVFLLKELVKIM